MKNTFYLALSLYLIQFFPDAVLFIVSKNTFEEKFLCKRQNLCDIDIIIDAHAQQNFFNYFFFNFSGIYLFFYLNWSNLLLWHACIVHKSMIRKKLQSHYWKLSPVILQSFFRVLYCICRAFRASWSCKYNKTIGLGLNFSSSQIYLCTCFRSSNNRRMVLAGNFGYTSGISRFSDLISGKVGRQEIDEKTIGRG